MRIHRGHGERGQLHPVELLARSAGSTDVVQRIRFQVVGAKIGSTDLLLAGQSTDAPVDLLACTVRSLQGVAPARPRAFRHRV